MSIATFNPHVYSISYGKGYKKDTLLFAQKYLSIQLRLLETVFFLQSTHRIQVDIETFIVNTLILKNQ